MTPDEALDLLAAIRDRFPNQRIPDETLKAYAEDLLDLDFGTAQRAVRRVVREADFWPSVARIRRAYAEVVLDAPTASAAFQQALGERDERHALAQIARRRVGAEFDWKEGRTRDLRYAFKDAYADVLEESIREIVLANLEGPTIAGLPVSESIVPRIEA